MTETKRGLGQGMLLGSAWNFLVGVLGPVAILFVPFLAIGMHDGGDIELPLMLLGVVAGVCGCLFVVHQAILIVVTLYYRSQFHAKSASDLKSHLVSWVVCADVILATAITIFLPRRDWGTLLGYFALFAAAGIFGGYLYARSVCASVDVAARSELDDEVGKQWSPIPFETAVGPSSPATGEAIQIGPTAPNSSSKELPPARVEPDLRRKSMPAVRLSVTFLLLIPLMLLFGRDQSWHVTFVIALISFGAGRLAEMAASQGGEG